jgi:hypothetical protein
MEESSLTDLSSSCESLSPPSTPLLSCSKLDPLPADVTSPSAAMSLTRGSEFVGNLKRKRTLYVLVPRLSCARENQKAEASADASRKRQKRRKSLSEARHRSRSLKGSSDSEDSKPSKKQARFRRRSKSDMRKEQSRRKGLVLAETSTAVNSARAEALGHQSSLSLRPQGHSVEQALADVINKSHASHSRVNSNSNSRGAPSGSQTQISRPLSSMNSPKKMTPIHKSNLADRRSKPTSAISTLTGLQTSNEIQRFSGGSDHGDASPNFFDPSPNFVPPTMTIPAGDGEVSGSSDMHPSLLKSIVSSVVNYLRPNLEGPLEQNRRTIANLERTIADLERKLRQSKQDCDEKDSRNVRLERMCQDLREKVKFLQGRLEQTQIDRTPTSLSGSPTVVVNNQYRNSPSTPSPANSTVHVYVENTKVASIFLRHSHFLTLDSLRLTGLPNTVVHTADGLKDRTPGQHRKLAIKYSACRLVVQSLCSVALRGKALRSVFNDKTFRQLALPEGPVHPLENFWDDPHVGTCVPLKHPRQACLKGSGKYQSIWHPDLPRNIEMTETSKINRTISHHLESPIIRGQRLPSKPPQMNVLAVLLRWPRCPHCHRQPPKAKVISILLPSSFLPLMQIFLQQ